MPYKSAVFLMSRVVEREKKRMRSDLKPTEKKRIIKETTRKRTLEKKVQQQKSGSGYK